MYCNCIPVWWNDSSLALWGWPPHQHISQTTPPLEAARSPRQYPCPCQRPRWTWRYWRFRKKHTVSPNDIRAGQVLDKANFRQSAVSLFLPRGDQLLGCERATALSTFNSIHLRRWLIAWWVDTLAVSLKFFPPFQNLLRPTVPSPHTFPHTLWHCLASWV